MRFEIAQVERDVDPEYFRQAFYLSRKPVVVRAAAHDWPARRGWTVDGLRRRIEAAPGQASRQPLWWDVDASLLGDEVQTPAVVDHLLHVERPVVRERCMRVWGNAGGHRTPWHYDGNSVDVFNVQVTGHKRFTLVSPETPLPCAPFSILARDPMRPPDAALAGRHVYTQFELRAGDMLFLPRHWFHFVESLAADNTNLNWVWTDLATGPHDHRTGRRERELVAFLHRYFEARAAARRLGIPAPATVSHFDEAYAREYGGEGGFAVARRFAREVGFRKLLTRAGAELRAPKGRPFTPG